MIAEQRHYYWLRWLVIGSGVTIVAALLVTSWVAWPVVANALYPTTLSCGCGIVRVQQSALVVGVAGAVVALAGYTLSRLLWRFVYHIRQSRRYHRHVLRRSVAITDEHGALLYRSVPTDEQIAVTIGFFRPQMYLSQGMLHRLTGPEIQAVLRHEQAHQRSYDPLILVVIDCLSYALHMIPGTSTWVSQAYTWRELAADALATDGYRSTAALSSAFVKFSDAPIHPSLAAFSPNQDRLEKLLDRSWTPRVTWRSWLAPSVLVIVVGLTIGIGRYVRAATPSAPTVAQACHETMRMCTQPHSSTPTTTVQCASNSCITVPSSLMSSYVSKVR